MEKSDPFYKTGNVYWYKQGGLVFGAIVLDYQDEIESFLVAISETISNKKTPLICDVLNSQVYTLAWFDLRSMKNPNRIHYIGKVSVEGTYAGRSGLIYRDDGSIIIKNCGQRFTWAHKFRSYRLKDTLMKEVLSAVKIPTSHSDDTM
ncbi:MAG: hypothetical protein E7426_04580 [Ruminococcaceae bacterium]|nr:hypothetical protein [Oscillospiraceae bacterium]